MTFPGRRENEQIKLIIRKHKIIFLFLFIKVFMLILLPFAVMIAVTYFQLISLAYLPLAWAFFLLIILFCQLVIFVEWLNEELDTVIVTDERIINVNQISFLHRSVIETSLAHVSDARGVQRGIWSDLFNYGILELQSENSNGLSRIEYVAYPFKVAEQILEVRNNFFKKHSSFDNLKTEESNVTNR